MSTYAYDKVVTINSGSIDTTPVYLVGNYDSATQVNTIAVLTVEQDGVLAPTAVNSYGVSTDLSGGEVLNSGLIQGGAVDATGIKYGAGAYLIGGRLENYSTGVIRGGAGEGSYSGGVGVFLENSGPNLAGKYGNYSNGGIYGGNGGVGATGGTGAYVTEGASLQTGLSSTIEGGTGGAQAGTGGIGVEVGTGGNTRLYGVTRGGVGGAVNANGIGGTGGIGIEVTSTDVTSRSSSGSGLAVSQNGDAYGGQGGIGAAGGVGIYLQGGASAQNTQSGTIAGGAGGSGSTGYAAGTGGMGAKISAGTLYNYGTLKGGTGGYNTSNSTSGDGGVGAYVAKGATLANASGIFTNGGFSETISGSVSGGLGAINGTGGIGVELAAGATVNNYGAVNGGNGGTGGGGIGGVGVAVGGGTLTNAAVGASDSVLYATFTTTTAASITGGNGETGFFGGVGGAGVTVGAGSVSNDGNIAGGMGGGSGQYSFPDGAIGELPQGGGGGAGLLATGAATLSNAGTITGGVGGPGGQPPAGYVAPPRSSAIDVIEGVGGIGVNLGSSGATFDNSGTIKGGAGGIFNLVPGSAYEVVGSTGGVGASLSAGTLTNSGAIIGGYGTNTGGEGVYLTGGTLANDGGSITGGSVGSSSYTPGVGVVLGGGLLVTSGSISEGSGGKAVDSVQFIDNGKQATLEVESGAKFGGAIGEFSRLDTIDLGNLSVSQVAGYFGGAGASLVHGSYVFAGGSAGETLATKNDGTLNLTGNFSRYDFVLTADSGQGTDINLEPACYCRGTRIDTEHGSVAIERLKIGDLVKTVSNGMLPIRWIGWRSYDRCSLERNPDEFPVRIAAGALGNNLPWRDLRVSQSHAILIDGMLLPAGALVNGHSIAREISVDHVTYFHLEFDVHAVIFAEGAPAESFVDDASRETFENAAEFHQLYPEKTRTPARFCAPRIEEGWELEQVRQRLGAWVPSALLTLGKHLKFPPN